MIETDYLHWLLKQNLTVVHEQPKILQQETLKAEHELKELLLKEYKTLLDAHIKSTEMASQLSKLPRLLEQAQTGVPVLREAIEKLKQEYPSKIQKIEQLTAVQRQAQKVQMVLSIPSLLDQLVKGEYYEEAMDLMAFVDKMKQGVVFNRIKEQCLVSKQEMVEKLSILLSEPVKLPLLIRVIGHFRRMQLDEQELQVMFLRQRGTCLDRLLEIDEKETTVYVRRYIDTTREHLFDILTHFKAIFINGNPKIIGSFCNDRVDIFCTELERCLQHKQLQIPHLTSIMNQTMYFGMSLGRVGVDFRLLVVSMFEDAILKCILSQLDSAMDLFQRSSHEQEQPKDDKDLMSYPALAHLYNRFISCFNQLRTCCPSGIESRLKNALDKHMDTLPNSPLVVYFKSLIMEAFSSLYPPKI
ncbi:Dor1-like family-domain-containing protein [Gorgonomyces haynaldii]|nr:Dor1-like family-domain-containing protein [Gorgonomyces haynaldii]